MAIRLGVPVHACPARIARQFDPACNVAAANDNGRSRSSDAMLHAALRQFAAHGFAAAQRARMQAEAARIANDAQSYEWWLDVCRTLDRRTARELSADCTARY